MEVEITETKTYLETTEPTPTTVEVIQQVISIVDPSIPPEHHGDLTGLLDDDHTQYVLATGARAAGELRLTPKPASSGPEGTIFYASADDHVWVATE